MAIKTFKEIRDFCRTDGGYREYYDVPAPGRCTREQWERYHKDRGDGTTYCGTVLYGQSQERLAEFLGQEPPHILLTLDLRTFEVIDKNPYNGLGLAVSARVSGDSVRVEFSEPFLGPYHHRTCSFSPTSDRPFSTEGVIAEVRAYCDEHLLFPPGRYRDIQIERRWPKPVFVNHYRLYREAVARANEALHRDMLTRHAHDRFMSDEQAYLHLEATGIFRNLNCDEDERSIMAEALAANHNKQIYNDVFRHQNNYLP